MDIREKNIRLLKSNMKYLYDYLIEDRDFDKWSNSEKPFENDRIVTEVARDNNLITYVSNTNCMYRLNSLYYPVNEAAIWAKPFNPKDYGKTNRTFYVFGLGNGYFIKELLKIIDEIETVLIYEPSKEMFWYLMDNFDLEGIITRSNTMIFVEGINENECKELVDHHGNGIMYGDNVFLSLPHYDKLYPEKKKWFDKIYTDRVFVALMDRNTSKAFGKEWGEATIDNLVDALNSRFISDYEDLLPEDVPVIVVAAGPSLRKNVDKLKGAKGKALILAVDTALGFLEEKDIVPDFIVTLDAHKPLKLFENEIGKTQPMFVASTANPSVVKCNKGPKIYFDVFNVLPQFKKIKKSSKSFHTSGSVATTAFEIAKYIGAKTIILVGQDLAYTGETTHINGITDGETKSRFALVEGNYGEQLWTRQDWYAFLVWYGKQITLYDGKVINATEGGAKIDGAVIMNLEEAIAEYCVGDFNANSFLNMVPCPDLGYNEIDKKIQSAMSDCTKTQELVKEAIELCDFLIEENQTIQEESYVAMRKTRRLSDINNELSGLKIDNIVRQYMYEVTLTEYQMIFNRYKEMRENRLNVYTRAKRLYQSTENVAIEIRNRLESVCRNQK